jgi:Pyridoxamine 5'-phosphate oxidase
MLNARLSSLRLSAPCVCRHGTRFLRMRARAVATEQRLSVAEEIRTLIACQKFGTICTISSDKEAEGFPAGAVMPYAVDASGRIICSLTPMSQHMRDLKADGRASVVVANQGFSSMTDARCSITGRFEVVTDESEKSECRTAFQGTHPDAYWSDFGDFSYLRMREVVHARLVGGFGRAGKVRWCAGDGRCALLPWLDTCSVHWALRCR